MMIGCPTCGDKYEDDRVQRLIPFNGYQYHVCKACHLAYLAERVRTGERLHPDTLKKIADVRNKVKKSTL